MQKRAVDVRLEAMSPSCESAGDCHVSPKTVVLLER